MVSNNTAKNVVAVVVDHNLNISQQCSSLAKKANTAWCPLARDDNPTLFSACQALAGVQHSVLATAF